MGFAIGIPQRTPPEPLAPDVVLPYEPRRSLTLARLASNDIFLAKKLLEHGGGEVRAGRLVTTHDVRGVLTASEERRFNVIADSYTTIASLERDARIARKTIIAATACGIGAMIMSGVSEPVATIAGLCAMWGMTFVLNCHIGASAARRGAVHQASHETLTVLPAVSEEPTDKSTIITAKTDH